MAKTKSRGRGTKLTGAVGEFLTTAELCRRNLVATPFSGNVPHYDIVASGEFGGHAAIQVKTATQASWIFTITRFVDVQFDGDRQILGEIHPEPYPDIRFVMVKLGECHKTDRFFILTWKQLTDAVVGDYQQFLKKHDGVRPKKSDSLHCSLKLSLIEEHEDSWSAIMEMIPNAPNDE